MGYNFKLVLLIFIIAASFNFHAIARPLHSTTNLIARLKLDQQSSNCWDSLIQLQACTTEILLFFLNGETHLGHACCMAIRTISGQCWPNLMDTLGFTAEEGDILEGYCVKDADNSSSKSPPLPPSPKHVVPNNKVVPEQFLAP